MTLAYKDADQNLEVTLVPPGTTIPTLEFVGKADVTCDNPWAVSEVPVSYDCPFTLPERRPVPVTGEE